MTGNTRDAVSFNSQQRWSNYYLVRDLEDSSEILNRLASAPYISGIPELDGTAVDSVPAYREYHAPDPRSSKEIRANRTRYGKAKAYYGKTYIVPRSKVIGMVLTGIGAVLVLTSVATLAAIHLMGVGGFK